MVIFSKQVLSSIVLLSLIGITGCTGTQTADKKSTPSEPLTVKGCPEVITSGMKLNNELNGTFHGEPFAPSDVTYKNNQLSFKQENGSGISIFLNNIFSDDNGLTMPENQQFIRTTSNNSTPNIALSINGSQTPATADNYVQSPYELFIKTDRFNSGKKTLPGKLFICFTHNDKQTLLSGSFEAEISGVTINNTGSVLTQDDSYDTFNMLAKEALLKKHPSAEITDYKNHQMWRETQNNTTDRREFAYVEILHTPSQSNDNNKAVNKYILEKTDSNSALTNTEAAKKWHVIQTLEGNQLKEAHRLEYLNSKDALKNSMNAPAVYVEELIKDEAIYNSHFSVDRPDRGLMTVTVDFISLADGGEKKVSLTYELSGDENIDYLNLEFPENREWLLKEQDLSGYYPSTKKQETKN